MEEAHLASRHRSVDLAAGSARLRRELRHPHRLTLNKLFATTSENFATSSEVQTLGPHGAGSGHEDARDDWRQDRGACDPAGGLSGRRDSLQGGMQYLEVPPDVGMGGSQCAETAC